MDADAKIQILNRAPHVSCGAPVQLSLQALGGSAAAGERTASPHQQLCPASTPASV